MKKSYLEPKKLEKLQKRVWEIATEYGLATTDYT